MSTDYQKNITVFMAAYNAAAYISESIESILNQTYPHFELLIVDDGSTDETVQIVRTFNDSRIRLIENKKNRGLPFTRNLALTEAKGEFIAVLDSDDIAFPSRLEKQIHYFDQRPELAVLGGYAYIIDKNGKRQPEVLMPVSDSDELRALLLLVNTFTHSTVMMRTAAFRQVGGYPDYPVAQDYGLFSKLALKYEVGNIPEYLAEYRIHTSNITDRKKHLAKAQLHAILFSQLDQLLESTNHINADLLLCPLKNNPYSLQEYFDIYQEIIVQNRLRKQYPVDALERMLHDNWYFLTIEKGKSSTLRYYLKKPVFNRKHTTFKRVKRAFIITLKHTLGIHK